MKVRFEIRPKELGQCDVSFSGHPGSLLFEFNTPDFGQQIKHLWIMLFQFGPIVREKVIAAEKRFARFGKIFHGIGHRIRAVHSFVSFGVLTLNPFVGPCSLCLFVGLSDLLIVIAVLQKSMVIAVCQFMQNKVRHAPPFRLEVFDIRELNTAYHFRIAVVFA